MGLMGSFLDHLEDAERQRRTLGQREQRERAEIRAEYTKRNATRRHESVMRSSTPRTRPAQEGS
jgi:hypothetical protein